MDFQTVATVISTAGTLGLGGWFIKYRADSRRAKALDHESLIAELTRITEEREKDCDRKLKSQQEQIDLLRARVNILNFTTAVSSLPHWWKDIEGRYLEVDRAFEVSIAAPLGKKREDFIGHLDEEIFENKDLSNELQSIDLDALMSSSKATVRKNVRFHESLPLYTILKEVLTFDHLGGRVGYAGIAYPQTDDQD